MKTSRFLVMEEEEEDGGGMEQQKRLNNSGDAMALANIPFLLLLLELELVREPKQ